MKLDHSRQEGTAKRGVSRGAVQAKDTIVAT